MKSPHSRALALLCLTGLAACIEPPGKDSVPGEDSAPPEDSVDSVDSDTQGNQGDDTEPFEPPELRADISGTVTVQPYTTDENGDMVLLDWSVYEAYTNGFPYGSIFVAGFTSDEGRESYHGETTIAIPAQGANPFHFDVRGRDLRDLRVYAALDFWGEGVIEASDPVGIYPEALDIVDGAEIEGVDITIMAPLYAPGGGGCDTVSLSGPYEITVSYAGGMVGAMVLRSGVPAHYAVARSIPTPVAGGAEGDYELVACVDDGPGELVAAWDSNGNDLFDPADRWGAYVSEPEVNGNPVIVGATSLEDLLIQIPFGDAPIMDLVPFVRLSGEVLLADATVEDLPEGSTLYVAALKYRPNYDLPIEDIELAYDVDSWTWDELLVDDALDFSLVVPANTIVYLWAYLDDEPYGIVNEPGDWVGTIGTSDGRVGVGEEDIDDLGIALVQP
jgi:hypothetical protein